MELFSKIQANTYLAKVEYEQKNIFFLFFLKSDRVPFLNGVILSH